MGTAGTLESNELKFREFHKAIYSIEKDIKKELNNNNVSSKKYMPYCLISHYILEKFPFLLNEYFDSNCLKGINFDNKYLIKKIEEKDFRYINERFAFSFPSNFIFINEDFMIVIRNYVSEEKYRKRLYTVFDIIIGGDCMILTNSKQNHSSRSNNYRYITLYNELKENKGNEIDFFLYINDDKKLEKLVEYILENNIWKFFEKVEYNYKDEYKKIDIKGNSTLYIVRNSDIDRIESFINKNNNSLNNIQSIPPKKQFHNFNFNKNEQTLENKIILSIPEDNKKIEIKNSLKKSVDSKEAINALKEKLEKVSNENKNLKNEIENKNNEIRKLKRSNDDYINQKQQ